jgi:hypothetical protein
MNRPKRNQAQLDLILFLGDPEDGAEQLESGDALSKSSTLKDKLPMGDDLYGAVRIRRDGVVVTPPVADPAIRLLTNLIRIIPYVIEGEPETVLLSESQYGFLVEPNGDSVFLSFFSGHDAFDPDEYLAEAETIGLLDLGNQLLHMAKHLLDLVKAHDPDAFDTDEYVQDLGQLVEMSSESVKSYRLEKERGLRQ